MLVLNTVKKFLDNQYDELLNIIDHKYDWFVKDPNRIFTNCQAQACGVVMFAQEHLDVDSEEVNKLFDEYVEKLNNLKKSLDN